MTADAPTGAGLNILGNFFKITKAYVTDETVSGVRKVVDSR